MEQHLWDYLYIRAAKEWCPNDKLRCVINMSGIFTHHKDLAAKKKKKNKERKKENQQFEVIICSVKVRRRDCGLRLTSVTFSYCQLKGAWSSNDHVWAQIMACDTGGEGAVSHYHCDPFNGGGLLFKAQAWIQSAARRPSDSVAALSVCVFRPRACVRARLRGSTCLFASEE